MTVFGFAGAATVRTSDWARGGSVIFDVDAPAVVLGAADRGAVDEPAVGWAGAGAGAGAAGAAGSGAGAVFGAAPLPEPRLLARGVVARRDPRPPRPRTVGAGTSTGSSLSCPVAACCEPEGPAWSSAVVAAFVAFAAAAAAFFALVLGAAVFFPLLVEAAAGLSFTMRRRFDGGSGSS